MSAGATTKTSDDHMRGGFLVRWARRPRVAVFAVVGVGAAIGWAWLVAMVASMMATTDMEQLGPGMSLFNHVNGLAGLPPEVRAGLTFLCAPLTGRWGPGDWISVFAMWVAMVMAMMLPSAFPVLSTYGEIAETRRGQGETVVSPVVLAAGYLAIWVGFAGLATIAQGLLTAGRLMSPAGVSASLVLAGTTTIAAGLYQFSPLKLACLTRCRTPRAFFAEDWTDRPAGVFRQGLEQGIDCLGCCWALMGVMFVVGVMNVVWIVVLGAAMTIEKVVPVTWISRAIGIVLLAWGAGLVLVSPIGAALLARVW